MTRTEIIVVLRDGRVAEVYSRRGARADVVVMNFAGEHDSGAITSSSEVVPLTEAPSDVLRLLARFEHGPPSDA